MARPTLKTPKIIESICERLAKGEPLARICEDDAMPSFNTVWRWENEDEEFRKVSTRAREIGTHHIADDCLKISDDPKLDAQDKRIRIDTRLRLIGKWNARRYGDKIDVTSGGEALREIDDTTRAIRIAAVLNTLKTDADQPS